MTTLLLIGFAHQAREWERELIRALEAADFPVQLELLETSADRSTPLDTILKLEKRKFGRSSATAGAPLTPSTRSLPIGDQTAVADLAIDLTGTASPSALPTLTLRIGGAARLEDGLQRLRTLSSVPDVVACLDGRPVAVARPMLSDKVWLSRDCNDVLIACQNLIIHCVKRFAAGQLLPVDTPPIQKAVRPFYLGYGLQLLRGLAKRAMRKLKPGSRPFYWQTGYRLIDGPGVAESLKLDGKPFTLLPDDGETFYADPFAFEHEGRLYLFVEEFPYALGRGILSVTELSADGTFGRPRPVLEEPHHLSYPNVFERDGEIFMIPESGAANEVVLYRAERFPDTWVRDTVLLQGICFNDATLLERDGRLWMFGTEYFGKGSGADTLMIFSATDLRGPWLPHRFNPILIDRAGARPGGRFIEKDDRTFLPVQDGTLKYGGGLGLREVIRLDEDDVILGPIRPVEAGPAWHGAGTHTLTRSGRLEIIDSAP